MVLADPEPVASERTEPCEEMAVEVMDISRKLTKKIHPKVATAKRKKHAISA
jgi:hypothetical protein